MSYYESVGQTLVFCRLRTELGLLDNVFWQVSKMATGSKQLAAMRMLMCMSLLVLVAVNMVSSVEGSAGSRKMQATIDCNLRHLAHKDMQGDFNSVAGWIRNLVKPLYHHRSHERRNP